MNNMNKKTKKRVICAVCGTEVYVDSIGNGDECPNCGWINCACYEEFPDRVMCPNLIPLNKAKKLYAEGKPFMPDFDDFIGGYNFYTEMEFAYKGIMYGVMGVENVGVEFFEIDTGKGETFKDIDEFVQKAQINGKLVKDIWQEVKNVNWLQ